MLGHLYFLDNWAYNPTTLPLRPFKIQVLFYFTRRSFNSSLLVSPLASATEETMASNINQVVLIVSIASLLLALFPQTESTIVSMALPPVDSKVHMIRSINSAMILGMQKAREYLQGLEVQEKDPDTPEPAVECLQTCQDVYEAALDDMKNTIEDLESENYYKVYMDMSSMCTNVDTCNLCYREMLGGEDLEAKNFSDWVTGITNDSLDKLEVITS